MDSPPAPPPEDTPPTGGSPRPGVVTARTGEFLAGHWIGAVAWCALFGGVAWGMRTGEVRVPAPAVEWAVLGLAALGPVLLVRAVLATLRALRFRGVTLALDPAEGSLGGELGGHIRVPGVAAHRLRDRELAVQVSCVRRQPDSETVSERIVWTGHATPVASPAANGSVLSFAVPLPADLPPSDGEPDGIRWYVRAAADLPGFDLDASFTVPVARHDPARSSSIPVAEDPADRSREFRERGIRVTRDAGAVWIRYGLARSRAMGVAFCVFGAVFAGSAAFIAAATGLFPLAWNSAFEVIFGLFGGIFVLAFGAVGGLLGLLGLWLLVHAMEVEVRPDRLRIRRRLLGFVPAGTREVATADLSRVEARVTSQIGQGARASVSYTLTGHTSTGKVLLGDGIRGPALLARVCGILEREAGLEVSVDLSSRRPDLRRSALPGGG